MYETLEVLKQLPAQTIIYKYIILYIFIIYYIGVETPACSHCQGGVPHSRGAKLQTIKMAPGQIFKMTLGQFFKMPAPGQIKNTNLAGAQA